MFERALSNVGEASLLEIAIFIHLVLKDVFCCI